VILGQKVKCVALQRVETILTERSTAVKGNDQVLIGDADLITNAWLGVAFLLCCALWTILLGALAETTSGDQDVFLPVLEAGPACDRAWLPWSPCFEGAVTIARHGVASLCLLSGVASLATILWLRDQRTSLRANSSLTVGSALGETRPLRHDAVNWAFLLVAFLGASQSRAPKTALIWRINHDLAVDFLPASTFVHLSCIRNSWASIIALNSALLADPIVNIAVNNFLSWASGG